MRGLPATYSAKWWRIGGVAFIVVTLLLWLVRFGLLEQPFTALHAFRYTLLSATLVLLITLAGWLGARLLWLFGSAGTLFGLILMAIDAAGQQSDGWEDLTSLLTFIMAAIIGLLAGVVAELIAWGWRALSRRAKG